MNQSVVVKSLKIWMLCLPLMLCGCIHEDYSNCPKDTGLLTFLYHDKDGNDVFSDHIDAVRLFIFNENSESVYERTLEKDHLSLTQGLSGVELPAGTYRIVCWGNVFDHTVIFTPLDHDVLHVGHPNLLRDEHIDSNDPLYYGEYELEVSADGNVSGTIPFVCSHIRLVVSVGGAGIGPDVLPVVEVENLYPEYDFSMQSCGTRMTYYPTSVYDADKKASISTLDVLRFENDNPIVIVVKDPQDYHVIHAVALKDFMRENNIEVKGNNELRIPLHFAIDIDLSVSVSIPEWEKSDAKPEL